ncbi:MAG: FadR/GntR family transcriptional regulator [Ruoffia tabacinasalis]|uniref:FadR/GntR family transcriptional regulator n=1 Tax=unclassified Ruoffia TaxID=2862149 RepID=UPI000EEACF84|nr:FadR family transcriptional regulator [Aerococcaceae bacterium]
MEGTAKSLIEQTSESILNYIITNNLSTGDKLPNEYKLAEEVNVGRSTLREAVRTLVSRNILEVRQGSGTYVSENTGIVDDPLGFSFVKDTLKLTEDLFEIRYLLEPRVAGLAATNATDEQIEELDKIRLEIEEKIGAFSDEHIEKDIEFHKLVSEMSGNVAMSNLVSIINQSISRYYDYYTSNRIKEETIVSHREIMDAIKSRDPILAEDVMRIHIVTNRRSLSQNKKNNLKKE